MKNSIPKWRTWPMNRSKSFSHSYRLCLSSIGWRWGITAVVMSIISFSFRCFALRQRRQLRTNRPMHCFERSSRVLVPSTSSKRRSRWHLWMSSGPVGFGCTSMVHRRPSFSIPLLIKTIRECTILDWLTFPICFHLESCSIQVTSFFWALISGNMVCLRLFSNTFSWGFLLAYYLVYENRRNEYVENFWRLVNWPFVTKLYEGGSAKRLDL